MVFERYYKDHPPTPGATSSNTARPFKHLTQSNDPSQSDLITAPPNLSQTVQAAGKSRTTGALWFRSSKTHSRTRNKQSMTDVHGGNSEIELSELQVKRPSVAEATTSVADMLRAERKEEHTGYAIEIAGKATPTNTEYFARTRIVYQAARVAMDKETKRVAETCFGLTESQIEQAIIGASVQEGVSLMSINTLLEAFREDCKVPNQVTKENVGGKWMRDGTSGQDYHAI